MGDPPPPAQALNVTGLNLNLTQLNFESRQLLQASMIGQEEDEKAYFVNYVPPSRDTIELPPHVVYILIGVVLVVVATYAIVGHLIKDLMHDLADWVLGPKPSDVESEGGMEEEEEEERGILYDGRIEKERMENTAGLLPGFYHVAGNYHPPALPLRSIITAFPSERRMSNQNVTLERPLTPHITSLMPIRNHPLISTPMEGVYI